MRYNPISRNFYRIRRMLMAQLSLPKNTIKPSSTFAELIQPELRAELFGRLNRKGIQCPSLRLNLSQLAIVIASGFFCGVLSAIVWQSAPVTVLFAIIGWSIGGMVVGSVVTDLDLQFTIGDAAMLMTSAEDCRDAQYVFNRKEIFLKIRALLADTSGIDRNEIKRETRLLDLFPD